MGSPHVSKLVPSDDPLALSQWMYSPFFPEEMFVVEGKWVRALMRLGFRQLTVNKVSRRLNQLWPKSGFATKDDLREAINDWLYEEGHILVVSKIRFKYLFAADERAELTGLLVQALAHALGVTPRSLFSNQRPTEGIGMYRCIAVIGEQIYQRIYLLSDKNAAVHRCFTDLLIGASKITASPQDWYKASFDCVEIEYWPYGVSVEELAICLGRIGMKCVDQRQPRMFSRISDEAS